MGKTKVALVFLSKEFRITELNYFFDENFDISKLYLTHCLRFMCAKQLTQATKKTGAKKPEIPEFFLMTHQESATFFLK